MSINLQDTIGGFSGISSRLAPTLEAVRTNCHITDARHAADYTLCVYLLKMREYYRWENDIPFGSALPHQELTSWLTQREALWESLEENPFGEIPVSDRQHDPFDALAINRELGTMGYVYSSGLGRNMKPHFFLGILEEKREHDNYTLYVSGREYARDLTAPPAVSLGTSVFIRRESLRRMLWEKIEEWRWNKPANAMQKAISYYDFDTRPEAALEQMTEREIRSAMLHEIGEVMAGSALGSDWEGLLMAVPHSKEEVLLRAVRDHLADALSTLPALLEDAHPASLHFYIANLTNMRKTLFPALIAAYEQWAETGNTRTLQRLVTTSRKHWLALAEESLDLFRKQGSDCGNEIITLVENRVL